MALALKKIEIKIHIIGLFKFKEATLTGAADLCPKSEVSPAPPFFKFHTHIHDVIFLRLFKVNKSIKLISIEQIRSSG